MRGKLLFLATASFLLVACDIFLAVKLGRWNPLDPDHELITKTVDLSPSLDGYVNEGDGAYYDDSSLRISKDMGGAQNASLLFFDLGEIPVRDLSYLTNAELALYCDSLDSADYLVIYPIRQSWNPAVTYTTVVSAGFIDNTIDIGNPLSIIADSENRYSVFPILKAWYQGLPNYGLRLHGDPNYIGSDTLFLSSNVGANAPRLVVTYLASE